MMLRSERVARAVKSCCPTCGGPIAFEELRVDLGTNTLLSHGAAVVVPPRHAEIASVLAAKYPELIARQDLIGRIWGNQAVSDKLLDVTICLTRRYLERVGFGIKNAYGQGYRLVKL